MPKVTIENMSKVMPDKDGEHYDIYMKKVLQDSG